MNVISARLFRTETLSLRQFFEDNGFSSSFHGSQAIISHDQEFWAKGFDESNSDAIVKFMKKRCYLSMSDAPACFAVEELLSWRLSLNAKDYVGNQQILEIFFYFGAMTVQRRSELLNRQIISSDKVDISLVLFRNHEIFGPPVAHQ
jgi:hypothetical protein